jgi:hypothetical protein
MRKELSRQEIKYVKHVSSGLPEKAKQKEKEM